MYPERIFTFGNIANFRSTHSSPHPSLPAQTTWSRTEAQEASLSHPPHPYHLVCSKRQALSLASFSLLVKGKCPPYLNIQKVYTHCILTSYKYLAMTRKGYYQTRGLIFSCVRPFYERALSNLDMSMHRSL
jgi:hypothetical protein